MQSPRNFDSPIRYFAIALCLIFLLRGMFLQAWAHNGAIAIVRPLEGITIDGKLDDWPEGMPVYPIVCFDYGDKPSNSQDLRAVFRIGYSVKENGLFVAVEVEDESTVLDPNAGQAWDTQEGCSLYLDESHLKRRLSVEQYFLSGDLLQVSGFNPNEKKVTVAVGAKARTRVYEWRLKLDRKVKSGMAIGFDIDVTDKDADTSFTWAGWGAGTQKTSTPGRTGDLIFVPHGVSVGSFKGQLQWDSELSESAPTYPMISARSLEMPELSVRLECDDSGIFAGKLPIGSYVMNAVSSHRMRIIESDHLHFTVQADRENSIGDLWIRRARDPSVRQIVEEFVREDRVTGLAVAIVKDGEILFRDGFGVRSLELEQPVTPDSIFHMASLSKPFVATAIMQLVEAGKLALDDAVVSHLKYFRMADKRHGSITIRHMLQHTSGMPDVEDYGWENPQLDAGAPERYVRSLIDEKLLAKPGARWRYSNMAYDVLGEVISKVSGLPFDDYVKTHILDPLQMRESTFRYPDTTEELRTRPHIRTNGVPTESLVYPYNRCHSPSSTLNSNMVDMTRWVLANLNRGQLDGNRVLRPESFKALWDPSVRIDDEERGGLSWFIYSHRGNEVIGHSGSDIGFVSQLALIPAENLGLVIVSNDSGTPIAKLRNRLLNSLVKPRL